MIGHILRCKSLFKLFIGILLNVTYEKKCWKTKIKDGIIANIYGHGNKNVLNIERFEF